MCRAQCHSLYTYPTNLTSTGRSCTLCLQLISDVSEMSSLATLVLHRINHIQSSAQHSNVLIHCYPTDPHCSNSDMCRRTYCLFPCGHPHLREFDQCQLSLKSSGHQCFRCAVLVQYPPATSKLDTNNQCRECLRHGASPLEQKRSFDTAKGSLRIARQRRRFIFDDRQETKPSLPENSSSTVEESVPSIVHNPSPNTNPSPDVILRDFEQQLKQL